MQLPATADVDKVNDRVFQITLCDGDYANIIVDLAHDDGMNPEIRVYPSAHPTDAETRVVIPLRGYQPASGVRPTISTDTHDVGTTDEFSICLPYDGEVIPVIRVEPTGSVPYITVHVPEGIDTDCDADPVYAGYVVHMRPGEQHSE